MNNIVSKLHSLDKPIRAGIAGAGEFGVEMITQASYIKNFEVCCVCDLDLAKAKVAFVEAGYSEDDIAIASSAKDANALIARGKRVIMDDAMEMTKVNIDAVCDVTGAPYFGAEFAYRAIDEGKHTIVVNIESDVGVGAILSRHAMSRGVVYTEGDGDQPSLIKGLYEWSTALGIEVVTAGKWTTIFPPEHRPKGGGRVDSGYFDGSKNQVEMCCVANMTGLIPDTRGMHKPSLTLTQIVDTLIPKSCGGILDNRGVIDVVNCLSVDGTKQVEPLLGGGVFVIGSCDNKRFSQVIRTKNVIHSKDGLHALFYRPYHLVGIEAPMSIIKAVLYNEATGAPLPTPVADVFAIAKTALKAGTRLDGIGGLTVRGEVDTAASVKAQKLLPLCLAEDVVLSCDVPEGTPITYNMLKAHNNNFMWSLRKKQDML